MDRESIKAEMDGRANEILMARIEYEQDRSEENGLEWIRRSMELGDLLFGQGMYRDAECAYSRPVLIIFLCLVTGALFPGETSQPHQDHIVVPIVAQRRLRLRLQKPAEIGRAHV